MKKALQSLILLLAALLPQTASADNVQLGDVNCDNYVDINDVTDLIGFVLGMPGGPVATKAPNELGLYDMSGNVYEWCQDRYGLYTSDAQTNPTGPVLGSNRVIRGGGWLSYDSGCRLSGRDNKAPTYSHIALGFRLAL